ncbi:HAD superfamily hydrolase [Diaporthe helianthi]|uniref:HAD superfamily hydrolase n=1 Tax=Diaporthe helianthi TaxID=158607 RepID=A0A2P5I7Q2_DIAHE|nr:HAD superfamily hydrolase [Diaporthe helianthi]
MSAASRVKAVTLPLQQSSLLSRNVGSCCYYSFAAAARSLPGQTERWRAPLSRGAGATATRAWRVEGLRWNSSASSSSSSNSSSSSSSSSSAASEDGESVASSQTSLGSGSGIGGEAQPAATAFAFAFDIDGVLLHTSKPIPGATETLRFLQRNNIPFILLTNGGGKPEAERVADLAEKLGVELDVSNFVQSHTPFQRLLDPDVDLGYPLLEQYLEQSLGRKRFTAKDTVLVLGSDASKARRIANGYGFESVVTPGDILKACPEIFPFDPLREFYDRQETLPLPKPIYNPKADPAMRLEDCLKIDGILTFNDPRDWAVDVQLITDLMLSHRGYLGTFSSKNNDRTPPRDKWWQSDGQPPIIFSNVDLQWSTGYHMSRLGQGSFRGAVRQTMKSLARGWRLRDVKTFEFGKPSGPTYAYAWDTLERYRRRLGLPDLKAVYMVGDNPSSDIAGALTWNSCLEKQKSPGPYWKSCLVRTGVWREDVAPIDRLYNKPTHAVDDVRAAVQRALDEQKWPGKFE